MEGRATVLRAVAEAMLPPLEQVAEVAAAAGDPLSAQLFRHSGASDEVVYKVIELIEERLTPESRRELYLLLRLLGSRLGSLLLLGRASFSGGWGMPSAFPDLPLPQREAVLQAWSGSTDVRMRKAFKGLKSLLMVSQFTHLSPEGNSDLLAAMRYPITDPARPPQPAPAAVAAEAAVAAAVVDLSGHDASPGSAAGAGAALAAKGMRVAWPGDFSVPAVAKERPQLAVVCDVVIVGSGAGGGVAAANLAAAGLKVVVLQKAGFVPTREMTLQEGEAFQRMYEQGGILATEDGGMSVLAGSTLGGGTRVNWCASFRTPAHVRREWAEEQGLPDFASPQYDDALDAVCSRLSVHTGFKHSGLCSALKSGLDALGVHCAEVPRSCLNADCGGHCCLGCARGYKQDAVNTWLADACQAGVRIITGAWVERVLLEPSSSSGGAADEGGAHPRRKKAVGVLAYAGSCPAPLRLAIQAPIVISAAGSIHSPALLLRSKLSGRGNVGANLRLHPCTCVVGVFPPDPAQDACTTASSSGGQQQAAATSAITAPGAPAFAAVAAEPAVPAGDMEDLGAPQQYEQPRQQDQPASSADAFQQQRRLHTTGGSAVSPSGSSDASHGGSGSGSIRCWEGTLMSIFSTQAGDWEGSGYGSLLYTPSVHPGLFAAAAPWVGGADFKDLMLQYNNCCIVLVLTRDRGTGGRVAIDKAGRPRLHYSLDGRDEGAMMKGVELGLRCMAAAGAGTVMTMLNSPAGRFAFAEAAAGAASVAASAGAGQSAAASSSVAGKQQAAGRVAAAGQEQEEAHAGGSDGSQPGSGGGGAGFESFLGRVVQTGAVPLQMPLFSAHQMGTCRLGADPATSVLDPSGECWEAAGLYCCDGSTFPTPTGVNPMISIEAISYMLTKHLARRLAGSVNSGRRAAQQADGGDSKL